MSFSLSGIEKLWLVNVRQILFGSTIWYLRSDAVALFMKKVMTSRRCWAVFPWTNRRLCS